MSDINLSTVKTRNLRTSERGRGRPNKLTERQLAFVVRQYRDENKTLSQCVRLLGSKYRTHVTQATLSNYLRQLGVTRPRGRRPAVAQ